MDRRIKIGGIVAAGAAAAYFFMGRHKQPANQLEQKNADFMNAIEREGRRFDRAVGDTADKAKSFVHDSKDKVVDQLEKPREDAQELQGEMKTKTNDVVHSPNKKDQSKWF
ncbi:Schizosaccharomyces specific protein [Schizosaccharomyces osmophilus]|uniref:Schizosaccharomyces specific protein n=1 Tax=Schizosaccharomyces osmophilus TaxID=2545709 RepID=A0AAF0B068_9SCHI|nr:Schizosaccharomyces specific protein [Schizosaccharomyces osmophilus]WBW75558.1 Schizosaccharomyces specific protein [Schizosaccharomyces osmophilus]